MGEHSERHPHVTGTGPGAITADGCPVELWATLPAGDAPAILEAALPARASVLDLGAGAGRLTHPLIAAGHPVTAVDESPEMLACIEGAETVCSTIEDLELGPRFDAVLLASHLVNVPDDEKRHRLLVACRRHLAPGGILLIQRYTRRWADAAGGVVDLGAGVTYELSVTATPSADSALRSVVAAYTLGAKRWEQSYVTRLLDDHDLGVDLGHAELRLGRWLTDDGRWVGARAVR